MKLIGSLFLFLFTALGFNLTAQANLKSAHTLNDTFTMTTKWEDLKILKSLKTVEPEKQKPAESIPKAGASPQLYPSSPSPTTVSPQIQEINTFRQSHGKNPLSESASLDASVQGWANVLSSRGYYNSGSPCSPHRCNHWEIAAWADYPANPVVLWENSSPHRAILLGDFTIIGYAEAYRDGIHIWVAELQ